MPVARVAPLAAAVAAWTLSGPASMAIEAIGKSTEEEKCIDTDRAFVPHFCSFSPIR